MLPITADGWATAPRSWSPGAAQVLQGWIPWGLARRRTSRRGAPRAACGAGWGGEQGGIPRPHDSGASTGRSRSRA